MLALLLSRIVRMCRQWKSKLATPLYPAIDDYGKYQRSKPKKQIFLFVYLNIQLTTYLFSLFSDLRRCLAKLLSKHIDLVDQRSSSPSISVIRKMAASNSFLVFEDSSLFIFSSFSFITLLSLSLSRPRMKLLKNEKLFVRGPSLLLQLRLGVDLCCFFVWICLSLFWFHWTLFCISLIRLSTLWVVTLMQPSFSSSTRSRESTLITGKFSLNHDFFFVVLMRIFNRNFIAVRALCNSNENSIVYVGEKFFLIVYMGEKWGKGFQIFPQKFTKFNTPPQTSEKFSIFPQNWRPISILPAPILRKALNFPPHSYLCYHFIVII